MIQHSKFQIIYRSIALLVCTHILTPCNRAENVPTTSIPSFYLKPTAKLRNVVWRGWEDSDEVVCPPRFSPPPGTERGELQSKAFPQLFPSSPQLLRPGDWRGLGERSPPSPSGENQLLSRPLLSRLSSVISQLDILSSQFSWICSLVLKISDVWRLNSTNFETETKVSQWCKLE